jgi:nuclear pore complex protein Nup205
LDEDVPESELDSPAVGDTTSGDEDSSALRRAIRLAILDLFLANTRTDRSAPNIAHLLLGFDAKSCLEDMEIEDPAAADTKRTSLHVILELLAQNVSSDETEVSVSESCICPCSLVLTAETSTAGLASRPTPYSRS